MRTTAASVTTKIPMPAARAPLTAIIADDKVVPGGIRFTATDGKTRRVDVPRATFDAEPKGDRYDIMISDCGQFVSYLEPLTSSG